jgi:hypothetical protein
MHNMIDRACGRFLPNPARSQTGVHGGRLYYTTRCKMGSSLTDTLLGRLPKTSGFRVDSAGIGVMLPAG